MSAGEGLFEKILRAAALFESHGIPFALGGAFAYSYCGVPRQTTDIDFNVFVPDDRGEGVVELLGTIGARPLGPDWRTEVAKQGQVRLAWGGTFLDLFFAYHDFHDECRERARLVPFADRLMPVLSCEDLAVFKVLFDRPRDWVDIENMVRVQAGRFDAALVRKWITFFLGGDDARVARFDGIVAAAR
ncbi:MAG: nucleotidyl transferase AbiEii/AbiGii toxin family protein [Hyphomicrobiales bacterium]